MTGFFSFIKQWKTGSEDRNLFDRNQFPLTGLLTHAKKPCIELFIS